MTDTSIPVGYPPAMTLQRAGSGIAPAPEGIASGRFLVQSLLEGEADNAMTAMRAFMQPGVMSHWHSHPLGQLLHVLDGVGLVQRRGGQVIEVRTGDCVWFAPDEQHWHGATPESPFSYICIQQAKNGTAVHWGEPVNAHPIA